MRPLLLQAFVGAIVGLGAAACDRDALENDARNVASAATSQVRDLTDASRAEWDARLKQGGDVAARYVDDRLKAWAAETEEGSIERRLAEGAGSAQMVAKIAAATAQAVDSETTILPVYRRIDAPKEDIDQAIGDMPRTEVIDGVTVGFKQLSSLDTEKHVTEKGYLVLWRKDDHLVGFVYRSKKEIDLGTVVKQAPAIIQLVRGVTG
jgi:hypothetical protein